jgi:hypothetical protein
MTTEQSAAGADFAEVFARDDRDRGADTAAPVTDAQPRGPDGKFAPKEPEAPPPAETTPPVAAEVAPTTPDPQTNRQVPLSELLGEREKRQSERKLREEAEKRASEYEGRVKAYERMLEQQRTPLAPQPEAAPPDFFADPEAAIRSQLDPVMNYAENVRLDTSEMLARDKHGDQAVDDALAAAKAAGLNRQFISRKNPYADLVKWHESTKVYNEIGPDPKKYRESLTAEIRAQVLAELKAGGTQPAPKFPGSLADATQAGPQGGHLTDEAIAAGIFSPTRNRRAG